MICLGGVRVAARDLLPVCSRAVAQRWPDMAHWAAYFDLLPNCFAELVPLVQEDNWLKVKNSVDTPKRFCRDQYFHTRLSPNPKVQVLKDRFSYLNR